MANSPRVSTSLLGIFMAATASIALAQTSPEISPESLTDDQVVTAIHKGIDLLIKDVDEKLKAVRKAADTNRGRPEVFGDNEPGELMLEAYALLHIGQELHDPRLNLREERVQLLKDVLTHWEPAPTLHYETYASSLQTLALSQFPRLPEVSTALNRAAFRLSTGMKEHGGYGYSLNHTEAGAGAIVDHSNSQYALLGAWSAADWGASVPASYWRQTDEFWRRNQLPDGSWPYNEIQFDKNNSPSMTAAGVASLLVCSEYLDRAPHLDMRPDPAIQNGLTALTAKFDSKSNNLYYLYGIERVGLASGLKYIANINWYRTIAANLIHQQNPDGSFRGEFIGASPVRNTSYAILFLVRGRAPIVMNKLQYDGSWNARPRDSANVHAYLTRIFERRLNWQIVPTSAPVDDWMDAPILYIAGSKDPEFTDGDVDKLRTFVQRGGIIFSVAEGGRKPFSDAMAGYAVRIAPPSANAAWRELSKDHPLFSVIGRPDPLPKLMGISDGIRELWIHSDIDFGAVWQSRNEADRNIWELPARIFMYVASKNGLHSKLQTLAVDTAPTTAPVAIPIARLQYEGNWDPEPGAWPRFAGLITRAQASIALQNLPLEQLATATPKPALAHFAGVGTPKLSEAQEKALHDYVNNGGTLFVEAIGGDKSFADAATVLIAKLFSDAKLKTVPDNYLLYTGSFSPNAAHITEVEYRKSWILQHGQQSKPRLQYLTVNGRVGIIFSAEDITHGLLGLNTYGIGGYAPDSALALARNITLFARINLKK